MRRPEKPIMEWIASRRNPKPSPKPARVYVPGKNMPSKLYGNKSK